MPLLRYQGLRIGHLGVSHTSEIWSAWPFALMRPFHCFRMVNHRPCFIGNGTQPSRKHRRSCKQLAFARRMPAEAFEMPPGCKLARVVRSCLILPRSQRHSHLQNASVQRTGTRGRMCRKREPHHRRHRDQGLTLSRIGASQLPNYPRESPVLYGAPGNRNSGRIARSRTSARSLDRTRNEKL